MAVVWLVVLGISTIANAGIVTSGLVSHWTFDEENGVGVADSHGSNHGTIAGTTPYTADTPGIGSRYALSFSKASGSYVTVADNASLNTSSRTVGAWIKVSDPTGYDARYIITKVASGTGGWQLWNNRNWNDDRVNYGNWGDFDLSETAVLNLHDDWHYIVSTYDWNADTSTGTAKIYIDGVLQATGTGDNTGITSYGLYIGGSEGSAGFNGLIDEVTYYNRALAAAEVLHNYKIMYCPSTDLTDDCYVDFQDLAILMEEWLVCDSAECKQLFEKSEVVPPYVEAPMQIVNAPGNSSVQVSSNRLLIELANGISIAVEKNTSNVVTGISDVMLGDLLFTPTQAQLIMPKLRNIDDVAMNYTCEYVSYSIDANIVTLHTQLKQLGVVRGQLEWTFIPRNIPIGTHNYTGFAYGYSLSGFTSMNIRKVNENTFWTLGGNIYGNLLPWVMNEAAEWRILPGTAYSSSYAAPRFAALLPFDYQMREEIGSLVVYYENPAVVLGSFNKAATVDYPVFQDSILLGKVSSASIPLKNILFTNACGLDVWAELHDFLFSKYQSQFGMSSVQPVPTLDLTYLVAKGFGGTLPLLTFSDVKTTYIPIAKDLGCKAIYYGGIWESEGVLGVNFLGFTGLGVNDALGGMAGLKDLCDEAHLNGIKIMVWFPTGHLYYTSPILADNPGWLAKNPDGTNYSWSYTDLLMSSFKTGYRTYALNSLKALKDDTGLDAFWCDSYGPAFTLINYAEAVPTPQVQELISFEKELQDYGYMILFEGVGPFGLSSHGALTKTFFDKEYLLYKAPFMCVSKLDFVSYEDFYRTLDYYKYLANKSPLMMYYNFLRNDPALIAKYRQGNKDYNTVSHLMETRRVLANDNGVEYNGVEWSNKQNTDIILFSYQSFSYTAAEAIEILDVTENETITADVNDAFTTLPYHTYWIKN
jgi:hypothetical protein